MTFNKKTERLSDKASLYLQNAPAIMSAMSELSCIPAGWKFRPWLFLPKEAAQRLATRWTQPLTPKITYLENTAPWFYPNGYRTGEPGKPYPDLPMTFQ